MTLSAEHFVSLRAAGGCVPLGDRAKWQLWGADRLRYLNGQITNDVRRVRPDEALYACVTNAKGRVEGDVYIRSSSEPDGPLWLDAEPGLRKSLGMRLEKYVVADDVEIRDVTEEWNVWHFFGPTATRLEGLALPDGARQVRIQRLGEAGLDLWCPSGAGSPPVPEGCVMLTAEEYEQLRIIEGVPRWPHELNGETFPQEAGLEARVMDFSKGCYIGQEILSRIKSTGKMPHHLVRFVTSGEVGEGALRDARLFAPDVNIGKEVGRVTSACPHPELDHWVGLAYVRQGVEAIHSRLLAGHDPNSIFVELEIKSR